MRMKGFDMTKLVLFEIEEKTLHEKQQLGLKRLMQF